MKNGPLASMPTARAGVALTPDADGRLYAIGGYDRHPLPAVERYDALTDTWEVRAPLPSPRYRTMAATAPSGRIYVFGGRTNLVSAALNELDSSVVYDPATDQWSDGPKLPHKRSAAVAVTANDGRIYLIGGSSSDDSEAVKGNFDMMTARVDAFDPTTGAWERRASLVRPRIYGGATLGADGRIYVVGGQDDSEYIVPDVLAYDPAADKWTEAPPLKFGRWLLGVASDAEGKLYAIGGEGPQGTKYVATNAIEVLAPGANEWTSGVPLPASRLDLRAARGADGRIFVIGGQDVSRTVPKFYDSILAFSPTLLKWTPLPSD